MRAIFVLLLSAPLLWAGMRVLSYDGKTARLGVSTDKQRFSIVSSTNRTNWTDLGTTWIMRGGTNEIVLSVPLPSISGTTYIKLAP